MSAPAIHTVWDCVRVYALNVEVKECDRHECYALDDFNAISTSRAVSSLGSCGSLIYHDFNTISTPRAVSSLGSCGSLIYHDFNTISTSRAVSSLGSCGSLIYNTLYIYMWFHIVCIYKLMLRGSDKVVPEVQRFVLKLVLHDSSRLDSRSEDVLHCRYVPMVAYPLQTV